MKWKLPIAVVALLLVNSIILTVVADVTPTKEDIINNEIKATTDRVFSQERDIIKERNERFKKVLHSIPNAKKHIGLDTDLMMRQVFEECETYKQYGLTIPIVMGIIEVESHFNPLAVGRGKDGIVPESFGLMQITAPTAKKVVTALGYDYDSRKMLKADVNIAIGTLYLVFLHQYFVAQKLEKSDEFHISLAAYNKGIEKVIAHLRQGKYPSFKYSNKVMLTSQKWVKAGF